MTASMTTAQAVRTVRSNYAALRRLEVSGGRTAATTNAVYRRRMAIEAAIKSLPRELAGDLAYENTLLENIAVSRRNGVERPELGARLAVCRGRIRAAAATAGRRNYEFGDEIEFTNRWGQERQIFTVIRQDGDRVFGDYLGIGQLFDLATMQIIETDSLGRPIVKN